MRGSVEIARQAAEAHSNLNTFHAVIALLEGGLIYGGGGSAQDTAGRIIRLCKAEAQQQLRGYDEAVARLGGDHAG